MVIKAIENPASDRVKVYYIGFTTENPMQHIVAIFLPNNKQAEYTDWKPK